MPTDEEQEWYCTRWLESMLESLDFEYDESKNPDAPKPPKRKRDEAKAKLDKMYEIARAEPAKKRRVYKCSKCGQPKKGHTCPKVAPESPQTN